MTSEPDPGLPQAPETVTEFPLSATQTRCWFLDQLQPGNPALNVSFRWELLGQVPAAAIERAFREVIARHEILRTRLVEGREGPVQQVVATAPFKLDVVDLRKLDAPALEARVDEISRSVIARPFDLSRPGLIRATLMQLEPARAFLDIVVHQSCFDGLSMHVLAAEVGRLIEAEKAGTAADLPELSLQYGDFTLWQQDFFASGALDEDAAYWDRTLQGAPYFEIDPDRPRPAVKSTDAAEVCRDLPEGFGARLEAAARAQGVSTFALASAAVAAALHRLTGARDVLFGTQVAGRIDADLEPLIGTFINNLILRYAPAPDGTLGDLVQASKGVVEGALGHQMMPFNLLVERLNPPRDAARNPLISINFALMDMTGKALRLDGFDLVQAPSPPAGLIYELDLALVGRPSGWSLDLKYAPGLFDAGTIEAILDLAGAALDRAMAQPSARLSALPLPRALAERGLDERRILAAAEAVLAAQPMVAEAAVVRHAEGLYAFVVPGATGTQPLELLPERLLAAVAGEPAAEGLTGLSLLSAFPRSSTGAVNRSLLRPPRRPTRHAAPVTARPEVVEALRADWAEILGRDDIAPDADFFDLGGHSVLVLRLIARLRDRLGVQLDVPQVYENAGLADLARLVSAQLPGGAVAAAPSAAPSGDWRILRLRKSGEGHPLIAVNNAATALALGTAGTAPRQTTCVRVFDSERGPETATRPFEAIAADYAALIREAQPEGPYLLYGNCVHGNLALEAARHLQAEGAEISAVVMKDVWEPHFAEALHADPKRHRREKVFMLKNRIRALRKGELSLTAALGAYRVVRRTGILQGLSRLGLIERARSTDLEENQERVIGYFSRMRDGYRPGPIDFPVLHVLTEITPEGDWFGPSIGWDGIVAPDKLRTVRLGRVWVERETRIGVDRMAREIETFLGERQSG